jgi:hypothetical protein
VTADPSSNGSDLAATLDQFDRAAANLAKLEKVWEEWCSATPSDISFGLDTPDSEELVRAFNDLAQGLPQIDGFRIEARPWDQDTVAQARFDALDLDITEARTEVERGISEPGRQIAEYRHRLEQTRRNLVRGQVGEIVASIDAILRDVVRVEGRAEWRAEDRWGELTDMVSELDRLVGTLVTGRARWSDFHRHLRFAESTDLSDIEVMDWPSVKSEVESALYDDHEPVPVQVDDLGALARARPKGPVSVRLHWDRLSDVDFEGLIFELIRQAAGYENANWLMRTHAPDRGRDLEAHRVVEDPLAGTRRYRVIIQCKHWLTKSVGRSDLIDTAESVRLWEPPRVDVLVVATTGRFSSDAVAYAEKRNDERSVPHLELWSDSHLETLLSRRPGLAISYSLR